MKKMKFQNGNLSSDSERNSETTKKIQIKTVLLVTVIKSYQKSHLILKLFYKDFIFKIEIS